MNSARHNSAVNAAGLTAAFTDEFEEEQGWFCAELADGLHAMAQPLTILRSAIAMLSVAKEHSSDQRRFVDLSVSQIDRTCSLFTSVQDLVALGLEAASQVPVHFRVLLSRMMEERMSDYQQAGVKLVVECSESLPPIFGDPQRTERAIAGLLEVSLSVSSQGDTVEMNVIQSNDFIVAFVTAEQGHGRSMNSSERLNLSLIKANVLTQRGRFRFTEEPFCVTLALPVCKPDTQGEETPSAAYAN